MVILTDLANLSDKYFRDWSQEKIVDINSTGIFAEKESDMWAVSSGKAAGRGVGIAFYLGTEIVSQLWVDLLRFTDGFASKTVDGAIEDLFRGVSLFSGGFGGKGAKYGTKLMAKGGKFLESQPAVIKAQKEFAKRFGAMLVRSIPMTVKSGKVYTNLAAVLHSRGISTLRYEVSGRVTDLVTMLKQAQIIKYFKHSTINPDVSDLGRIIGQNGSLFLRMNVLTPSHRFVRECVVFRDVRGRAMIKGEYGIYSSFKEYRLNEFSTGQDVKFVKLTDILESNVIRDIRFDFSKHRKLIGSLVELEGVALQNFDPMKIVEEYQKENPYID